MRVETAAEQLFFVTVLISTTGTDGTEWTGTGFIYGVNTDRGEAHFVVTNRHVLENTSKVTIHFLHEQNGQPVFGAPLNVELTPLAPSNWFGHQDPEVDVAVLPLGLALNQLTLQGKRPFFRSLPESLVPTAAELAGLDALERVVFMGYPAGLYDAANLTPIARQGLAATPIPLDYEGLPAFLIDAAVFPGSSGSPVFIFDRGMVVSRSGGVNMGGTRLHLLGVLASVYENEVTAEITTIAKRRVATVPQVLGLGIVFKSHTINECVDHALAMHGFKRIAPVSNPTTPPVEGTAADKEISKDL